MNRSRKRNANAFTLVEVVVVATIVAVVSIIATVMYTGYIREARQETVNNLAAAAAASANAYTRKTGVNLATTDSARLHLFFPDPTRFTVKINPGNGIHGTIVISEIKSGVSATASY